VIFVGKSYFKRSLKLNLFLVAFLSHHWCNSLWL